jgi:hypothetical protein
MVDIVQLYLPPDPTNLAIGNERPVFTWGLGQRRQQVAVHQFAHAADLFLPSPEPVQGAAPLWAD